MSAPGRASSSTGACELLALVKRHGRLPRLGDDPPPWSYLGWLLPSIVLLHGACGPAASFPAVATTCEGALTCAEKSCTGSPPSWPRC